MEWMFGKADYMRTGTSTVSLISGSGKATAMVVDAKIAVRIVVVNCMMVLLVGCWCWKVWLLFGLMGNRTRKGNRRV